MRENGGCRLRIGDFDFNLQTGKLLHNGQPAKIEPQPLRVFQLLIQRRGEVVSREDLHRHVWNGATFVEFDQGLNYCIRQIRRTIGDDAAHPTYIETLPKQGSRFIANSAETLIGAVRDEPVLTVAIGESRQLTRRVLWGSNRLAISIISLGLILIGVLVLFMVRTPKSEVRYTQITDFDDSAAGPALSPDGRLLAFFRSEDAFLTGSQIWIKMLPNGEAKLLTSDRRWNSGLAFSSDGTQVYYTVIQES